MHTASRAATTAPLSVIRALVRSTSAAQSTTARWAAYDSSLKVVPAEP